MQAVIDKIMEAKSVAVLTHLNEDPDTIGSCFAFAKVMRKLGKEATVYVHNRSGHHAHDDVHVRSHNEPRDRDRNCNDPYVYDDVHVFHNRHLYFFLKYYYRYSFSYLHLHT